MTIRILKLLHYNQHSCSNVHISAESRKKLNLALVVTSLRLTFINIEHRCEVSYFVPPFFSCQKTSFRCGRIFLMRGIEFKKLSSGSQLWSRGFSGLRIGVSHLPPPSGTSLPTNIEASRRVVEINKLIN